MVVYKPSNNIGEHYSLSKYHKLYFPDSTYYFTHPWISGKNSLPVKIRDVAKIAAHISAVSTKLTTLGNFFSNWHRKTNWLHQVQCNNDKVKLFKFISEERYRIADPANETNRQFFPQRINSSFWKSLIAPILETTRKVLPDCHVIKRTTPSSFCSNSICTVKIVFNYISLTSSYGQFSKAKPYQNPTCDYVTSEVRRVDGHDVTMTTGGLSKCGVHI